MGFDEEIGIGELTFKKFISREAIHDRMEQMAERINRDLAGSEVDILVLLDGAEAFANAILPKFNFSNRVHYRQVKTYQGTESTGRLELDTSWIGPFFDREVLILEDIIDTGHTLYRVCEMLRLIGNIRYRIATLLLKPKQLQYPVEPDYTGFEIGPDFVIGFGMDYNEQGRDLPDIYRLKS
ncbi:MAG TPA: phosphoribosyltransferase family protein [Saprospiraceae bacterium]|nr:phosphoribosyltransferase family protein [Saprospiraceae bacterium]